MRILFNMLPEMGHVFPTLPLARALRQRGHEVRYATLADMRPVIEALGFPCQVIHADAAPRGTLARIESADPVSRERIWLRVRNRIEEEYFDVEPAMSMLRNTDLLLGDSVPLSPLQLAAWRGGVPCLQLSSSLPQALVDGRPPLTSALPPDAPPELLRAARATAGCTRAFEDCRENPALYDWYLRVFCRRFAYPPREVDTAAVFWPRLTAIPEAILCEPALDFPWRDSSPPLYLPLRPELNRPQEVPEHLARFVARPGPLVYASLGSQPARYPHGARTLKALCAAMREAPAWRAVVAVGTAFDSIPPDEWPPNVCVLPTAPQLWMLARCHLFITHAGLGSLREAVAHRVPMIAIPQQFDQFGNAARLVFHGLGTQLDTARIGAPALTAAIETLLADGPRLRERLAGMDARCAEQAHEARPVEMIERLAGLAQPRKARVPPASRRPEPRAGSVGYLFIDSPRRAAALAAARAFSPIEEAAVAATLPLALSCGTGPYLARVRLASPRRAGGFLTGARLRCESVTDVTEILYAYARWCLEQFLAEGTGRDALRARRWIGRFHTLRRAGASRGTLRRLHAAARGRAAARWEQGMGVAMFASDPRAEKAACMARFYAMTSLFCEAVEQHPDAGGARDARVHRMLRRRFDRELARVFDEMETPPRRARAVSRPARSPVPAARAP